MSENNYRYCFYCDKWKSKSEINEVNLGGGNKTYNCNVCRKDLGEICQIIHCKQHASEILRVWGTLEGANREKIFYTECPQKLRQEQGAEKGTIVLLVIGGTLIIITLIAYWLYKKRKSGKV